MGVQQVSANKAFPLPAGAVVLGKFGGNAEDFAELVRHESVAASLFRRDRQRLIERERVAQVGIAQFRREQYEIRKMLRLMHGIAALAPADLRDRLEGIATDLEMTPPHDPAEMHIRIEATIACIPLTAPEDLRRRMKDIYAALSGEMGMPDQELKRLRRIEESARLQTAYQTEVLLTAAYF